MTPLFASTSWENFIIPLVLLVVSALSALMNKRRQNREQEEALDEMEPPSSAPTHPRQSEPIESEEDIQEALRRLLGGEAPPQPPPPPILPPVIAVPRPPFETEGPGPIRVPLPPRRGVPTARPIAVAVTSGTQPMRAEVPISRVATVIHKARHRSPQAEQVRSLIRDRRTVRAAFVTSQVFGPPKALETQP
jgi:hypothetical protein